MGRILEKIYFLLYNHFGSQHWWPGDGEVEIIVGAVLTQNTSWRNVERAIANLKDAGLVDIEAINKVSENEFANLIKPSGFYRIKAQRLKELARYIVESGGVSNLKSKSVEELRRELKSVKGIGDETADSIILYALEKPIFVVDSYTRRILSRLGLLEGQDMSYSEVQELFMKNLKHDVKMFNEFHALFVKLAKTYCTKNAPLCVQCPLRLLCSFSSKRILSG
ncbi:MAG: endonuclease III domain-containing protein [Candidatus Hydrothermia bacterium]